MKLFLLQLLLLLSLASIVLSNGNAFKKIENPLKSLLRKDQVVNFLAGGAAGTIASCLTIPLEVIKTQLQSSVVTAQRQTPADVCKVIWKNDGWKGFTRGLQPLLVGIIPTRAIYFWAYNLSKEKLSTTSLGDNSLNHLLSAFAAGITSNTLTNPLWMVRTRYQIIADKSLGQRAFKSYGEVVRTIMQEEGPLGFFKGLSASYIGCFEGAAQWMIYEKLKLQIARKRMVSDNVGKEPTPTELFTAAAASKFAAICLTYPHEVVRTRLREQATNGVFKYSGFRQTLSKIAREEGVKGLYSGLGMHLLRSVPNAAIMFVSFELVGSWIKKQKQMTQNSE